VTLKGGTQEIKFSGGSNNNNNASTVWRRTTKFCTITYVVRGVFLGGQPRPTPTGRGFSAVQLWGFFSIYAYTLCNRTTKFHMVTHMRKALVLGGQQRHTQRGRGPSASHFGVAFYLCIHPLSQNCQISRGNMGRGLFSGGQPHPTPRGLGPSAPQFWSSFLFMRIHHLA